MKASKVRQNNVHEYSRSTESQFVAAKPFNNKLSDAVTKLPWFLPNPYISAWNIQTEDIDHYHHTNNIAYLSRLEKLAWQHSNFLGLQFSDYQELDRAMVITQHQLNYHLASHVNDELACATWIISCDKKFRLSRRFQFIHIASSKTIFSARTDFVCVSLSSGLPKKMPKAFIEIYGNAVAANENNI